MREDPDPGEHLCTACCALTYHVEALCAGREALHLAVTLHEGAQAEAQVLCDVVAHAHCQPRNHRQRHILQAEVALMSRRYADSTVVLLGAHLSPLIR